MTAGNPSVAPTGASIKLAGALHLCHLGTRPDGLLPARFLAMLACTLKEKKKRPPEQELRKGPGSKEIY